MMLQFKHKEYQADAVEAVVDCFAGQPKVEGVNYRLDPGKLAASSSQAELDYGTEAFRNAPLKLYAKLPKGFSVPTPVGDYNPDWAILLEDDEQLYLVRETKSTRIEEKRRQSENDKVSCGRKHFESIGVDFDDVTSLKEVLAGV
mgnify:CR=1 FL=1